MKITKEMQDELFDLAKKLGGSVPAEALIEHAKTSNAWHPAFVWDDKHAGHQYRLMQARGYIARIQYIPAESNEPIRAFAQFAAPDDRGYLSTADVLADPIERERLVQTLIGRHLSIYNSYKLEEFEWLRLGLEKMAVVHESVAA